MSELNTVETALVREELILSYEEYPQIHPLLDNSDGNNYVIGWNILNGNEKKLIELFENKITLNEEEIIQFQDEFQILKDLYNFPEAYTTCVATQMNSFAVSRLTIPEDTEMNIFTGVENLHTNSNSYLNSKYRINTENIQSEREAEFLRESLVRYLRLVGIIFS
jgi:hypothetical protein